MSDCRGTRHGVCSCTCHPAPESILPRCSRICAAAQAGAAARLLLLSLKHCQHHSARLPLLRLQSQPRRRAPRRPALRRCTSAPVSPISYAQSGVSDNDNGSKLTGSPLSTPWCPDGRHLVCPGAKYLCPAAGHNSDNPGWRAAVTAVCASQRAQASHTAEPVHALELERPDEQRPVAEGTSQSCNSLSFKQREPQAPNAYSQSLPHITKSRWPWLDLHCSADVTNHVRLLRIPHSVSQHIQTVKGCEHSCRSRWQPGL